MAKLIKGSIQEVGQINEDASQYWLDAASIDLAQTALPSGAILFVSFVLWQAHRETLLATPNAAALGVQLAPADEPSDIADDLVHFKAIAIEFPQFTDGRGYSMARLLRERYGYTGELRAVGDVLRDQIFFMLRCGFDAFVVAEDTSDAKLTGILNSYRDFSVVYQTSVEQKAPLFRRRLAALVPSST